MKLLQIVSIVNTAGIYGTERSTIALSRGLAEQGHEVWLACRQGATLVEVARAAAEQVSRLHIVPDSLGNSRKLFIVWRMARLAKRHRVELIVAQDPRANRLALRVGRFARLPVVCTLRALSKIEGCNYAEADRIIAVSEEVRQYAIERGVPPERIKVVRNGIDTEKFLPPADLMAAKRAVGLEPRDLVVGVIARLSTEKGYEWFLSAAARVAGVLPAALFLLVGDGPLRADLEALAQRLGIADRTRFVGYQEDIVPWLGAMDVLVLPPIAREGFGRVLAEAGAMQKPVVGTRVGGISEVIADGETGFVVEPGDEEKMSEVLLRLLRDPDERQRMGIAGRRRVEAHFTVARMVEGSAAVYEALLREKFPERRLAAES